MSASGSARVITEPLGGSPLSLAVQARHLSAALQPARPLHVEEWRAHVERVRQTSRRTGWYDALQPAMTPTRAAAARLERVVADGGVVVTTGQQATLFGGPMYTLAKALTAIGFADAIEQRLGIPAAPVFWAATDDADFLEASVAHVADAAGLHALTLPQAPPAGTPMAQAALGNMKPLLAELRRACGSAANVAYFELTNAAFTRAATVGDAYVHMLRDLLEPLGMAVMDSSHAAYRAAARPMLAEALQRAPEIAAALTSTAAAIRAAGFEPQVQDDRGLSLVFAIEKGVKRRLTLDEARLFAAKGKSRELLPNVLLRPVVEREILPTVAYVGGPGELAYFTQSNAVATAVGRNPIVGVPRWSCTIVEPFAQRALQRLGVEYMELKDIHPLERRLATASLPEHVADSWKRLQEQTHAAVRALGAAVQESELLPAPVIEGLERSLAHRLARGERRLIAAAKRRNERVRQDLTVAGAALFPLGKRQERVLNFVPMLARGGDELLDEMRRAAASHASTLLGAERPKPAVAR